MKKKQIIVIRANTLDRETRATKIIKSLVENNYNVTFLGWDRGIQTSRSEKNEAGEKFNEISFHFKAPWGIKSILFLPMWWTFIFYKLMSNQWDLVHAIQITTSPPAIIAGKLKKKPVVYDMLDTYEDSIIMPIQLRNFFVMVDKVFMKLSSAIVLADEEQIEELGGIPNSNIVVVYDSPDTKHNIILKQKTGVDFTIFYAGLLYSGKKLNLDKMIEAVKKLEGVKLIIAGHGDLVSEIQNNAKLHPNKIEYIGEIPHAEVLQRSADADLLFVLRDPVLPVNRYICGSKILEAMMCGTPIMVGEGTSTAKIVQQNNCGFVIDAYNIGEIIDVINKLKMDPDLCSIIGKNGRKAFDNCYSWILMSNRLLKLYEKILIKHSHIGN